MNIQKYIEFFELHRVLFATNGDKTKTPSIEKSISLYKNISKHFYCAPSTIHGKNAFIDIFKYAQKYNYKYVIYIDADCFICSYKNLYECFNKFIELNCICSGIPDGGCIPIRLHNKYAINPFFSFFNIDIISKIDYTNIVFELNTDKILDINIYNCNACIKKCPHSNLSIAAYDKFEPYYDMFLSFGKLYPIQYLTCSQLNDLNDKTSTCVYNDKCDISQLICLHSWYARKSTDDNLIRINNLFNLALTHLTNEL